MLNFITENIGTILIGAAVLLVLAGIVVKLLRDRKKGKTACGCGCEGCPSSEICHTQARNPRS